MTERMVTVIFGEKDVTIPLADAVVEFNRLNALKSERPLKDDENRVYVGLVAALGTLSIGDGAQRLYAALTHA